MANEFVQTMADARIDAQSLSDFVFKPSGFKVARRLAPPIDTLQFYIDRFNSLNGVFSSSVSVALSSLNNSVVEAEGKVAYIETTVQDAINNTAVEGGILADTFVVATESGRNQREVNRKTVFEYDTVAAMLADTTIVSGKVVSTNGYHTKQDGGGAKYTIASIATDYSIPLANGLHAVFNDSFDIRKFGIRDNATLRQDVELLRMCKYADMYEYVIDFHGYSILAPNNSAGINNGNSTFNLVTGLCFDKVHHIKNLSIYADKINKQTTGKCLIVYTPIVNPIVESWFVLENVKLDPWSSNFQPFTDNYVSMYDGMRLGFFVVPKLQLDPVTGKRAMFQYDDPDHACNISFKFINVEFLSSAYSYNISTAGIRSRNVVVNGFKGDSILAINTDTVNTHVDNFTTNTRYDLLETGRLMVMSGIHYEPEHGSADKKTLTFNYDNIVVNNSNITRTTKAGLREESGQLLWFTCLATSTIGNTLFTNCIGNVEFQGMPESVSEGRAVTLTCDSVLVKDSSLWFGIGRGVYAKKITHSGGELRRIVGNNSTYAGTITKSKVDNYTIDNGCAIRAAVIYGASPETESIDTLSLNDVSFENPTASFAMFERAKIRKIKLSGFSYGVERKPFFRAIADLEELHIDNVRFKDVSNTLVLTTVYTDVSKFTTAYINGVSFEKDVGLYTAFELSGVLNINGYNANRMWAASTPSSVGIYTTGIGTLAINLNNINAPLSYTATKVITDNVLAGASAKHTFPVNKDCKDIALTFSVDLPTGISVSKYRYANTYVVAFTNTTAASIALGSITMTVKQLV